MPTKLGKGGATVNEELRMMVVSEGEIIYKNY